MNGLMAGSSAAEHSDAGGQDVVQALAESRRSFAAFLDALGDPVVILGLDGRVRRSNVALRRRLGFAAAELLGRSFSELFAHSARGEADQLLTQARSGARRFATLTLATKGGSPVPVECTLWLDAWNGESCIYATLQDLTPEKEVEQRFDRLFRNSHEMMLVVTLPGCRVADGNGTFFSKLGYARDEMLGASLLELPAFPQPRPIEAALTELRRVGHIQQLELSLRTRGGRALEGLVSGELITIQGMEYALVVVDDVTVQRQAQRTLLEHQRAKAELEERRAHLQGCLDAACVGTWTWERDSAHIRLDPQACAALGLHAGRFDGLYETFLRALHPEDRAVLQCALSEGAEKGSPLEPVVRAVWPDGSVHQLVLRGQRAPADGERPASSVQGALWEWADRTRAT